ncbi:MAG: Na/Pi cotransporter family protein [Paracoccaceae bacterium]
MQAIILIMQLTGAVMLLLYSTRMVRTGIERAAGPALRDLFMTTRKSIVKSVGVGVIAAILLQSATAVALVVAGFAAVGAMGVTGSLAVTLGADLGTALVVQFLSLDLDWLIPILLTVGGALFLKTEGRLKKQAGRILFGVAFILISLNMIGAATTPLRDFRYMPDIVAYLGQDVITACLGGMLIAFVFHSSVAAILLFAAFAAEGVLTIAAGAPLVLGANIGGALVAIWLTRAGHAKARRITTGNLIFRAGGAAAALAALHFDLLPLERFGTSAPAQVVNLHLAFNVALVIVALPFVILISNLTRRFFPAAPPEDRFAAGPSALDRNALNEPRLALASVTRELLRMAGIVDRMLAPVMDLFEKVPPGEIERIREMDVEINAMQTEVKLYLAELSQRQLKPEDAIRLMDYVDFAVALERVGDIVSKDLLRSIKEKHRVASHFSKEGWAELNALHGRVMRNAQLALNVLVSDDVESARELVEEKEHMRALERLSFDRHVERLANRAPESIATSDVHLETVRSLKEINSRFALFGYPVLRQSGLLLESRIHRQEP